MVRSSGTLDPFLRVVDGDRFVIAENDDHHSETRNARIDALIIERGRHLHCDGKLATTTARAASC